MTSGAQPINSGAPAPVQGVTGGPGINQGTASVEPGTGALVFHPNPANVVQVRGSTPGAFQVYEYFHTNTDFARVSLSAQTNGPFRLAVETDPTSVIRGLDIIAGGSLFIDTDNVIVDTSMQINGNLVVTGSGGGAIQSSIIEFTGVTPVGAAGVFVLGASTQPHVATAAISDWIVSVGGVQMRILLSAL